MKKATRPAKLEDLSFDAIINRETAYEADSPEYPVEDGFYVSDAILRKPVNLNVTAFISNTPVTWKNLRSSGRLKTAIKKLENMFFEGKTVTFSTSSRKYTSMVITSLTIPETEEMADAVEVKFTLKQIRVTKSKTTTIPSSYGLSGATAESGGTANTSTENDESVIEKDCSLLYGITNSK